MGIEEAGAAIENAKMWLGSAESNFRDGHYSISLYSLAMCVEIALKAVLLSQDVNVPKVHDVSGLLVKYSNEKKSLKTIKNNEKFISEVYSDLLNYRNIAGYLFDYRRKESEFKELVEEYMSKARKVLEICSRAIAH